MLKLDFKSNKLKSIRLQAITLRQYFDNHDMRANEFDARNQLEKIEFLLSLLDEKNAK